MNTRLKQFLAAENITQAQFADTIKVVRASVSHILSGRNNPSFDFIKAMMAHYPNLNMEWLMFGKGKMYKESASGEPAQLFDEGHPAEIPEIADEPKTVIPELFPTGMDTSNNTSECPKKQRRAVKIIVMYDDGSYQEL